MRGDCEVFIRRLRWMLQDADNSKAYRRHITGIERLVAGVHNFGGSAVQIEAKQAVFETLPFYSELNGLVKSIYCSFHASSRARR